MKELLFIVDFKYLTQYLALHLAWEKRSYDATLSPKSYDLLTNPLGFDYDPTPSNEFLLQFHEYLIRQERKT